MADLNVQRKRPGALPWIVGLIIVALLAWLLWEVFDRDDDLPETAVVPAPTIPPVAPDPQPSPPADGTVVDTAAGAAGIPVVTIAASPEAWNGRTVSGPATVAEVISDRGFWIGEGEGRMLVLLNEASPEIVNVRAGQQVRLTIATVRAPADPGALPGDLDADARRAVANQPAVLVVNATDVRIAERAGGG